MRSGDVDLDAICSMVRLDRQLVEEVVKRDLNSDMVKVNQAMGEWYDGHGPFKEAENIQKGWTQGGNKQKGRKADEEFNPSRAKTDEVRKAATPRVSGRAEARGRVEGVRGRGRGRGRDYSLQAPERRPDNNPLEKVATDAPAEQHNGTSHRDVPETVSSPVPESAIVKTFTSAKQPAINAWTRPKDWSELSAADSVVEHIESTSTIIAAFPLEAEQLVSVSDVNAPMAAPTRGERSGRGRTSSRDGGTRDRRHRDEGFEATSPRGRGRGIRREARGEQPSAITPEPVSIELDPPTNNPSESTMMSPADPLSDSLSVPSSNSQSMGGNAELSLSTTKLSLALPLPTPDLHPPLTDLPRLSGGNLSMPLNVDMPIGAKQNLLLSTAVAQLQNRSSSATALLAQSDPAILTVGNTVPSEPFDSCSVCGALQPDHVSAAIMPPTLKFGDSGDSSNLHDTNSKLQFGFGANLSKLANASAPAAAGGAPTKSQLTFGALASGFESICCGSSEIDPICAASVKVPVSSVLPLPRSLATALPTAGTVPLPGFCSASADEGKQDPSIIVARSSAMESPIVVPIYSNRKIECVTERLQLGSAPKAQTSNPPAASTSKSALSSCQQVRSGGRAAPCSSTPGLSSTSAVLTPALLQSGMPLQGHPAPSVASSDGSSRLAACHAPILQSLSAAPPPSTPILAMGSPGMGPPLGIRNPPGTMPEMHGLCGQSSAGPGLGYPLGPGANDPPYASDLQPSSQPDERRTGAPGQQPVQVPYGSGVLAYEPAPPMGLCGGPHPGYDLPTMPVQGPPSRSGEKEPNRLRTSRKKKTDRGPPVCDRGGGTDRGNGSALHGKMMADSMIPPSLVVGNTMSSAPQGPMMGQPGMMPTQQFAAIMPSAAMAHAMSFPCGNYGPTAGMVYAAPPGAGMYPGPGAGMYQPTAQYAPAQQFVAQPQSFVPQPQQPYISQQTGSAATGYVYQQQPTAQQLSMPSVGTMGGAPSGMSVPSHGGMGGGSHGGMGGGAHGMGVTAHTGMHTGPNFGYEESADYIAQPGMFSAGGYYRPN